MIGVFDGFGDRYVASWLSKNLEYGMAKYLNMGYSHVDSVKCMIKHADIIISRMKKSKYYGSTATCIIGIGMQRNKSWIKKYVVAHLGESMAYTLRMNGTLTAITEPHTPLHEEER